MLDGSHLPVVPFRNTTDAGHRFLCDGGLGLVGFLGGKHGLNCFIDQCLPEKLALIAACEAFCAFENIKSSREPILNTS